MKEEIKRTLEKCEEMGWIKILVNKDALVATFAEILQDMPLRKFVEITNPFKR